MALFGDKVTTFSQIRFTDYPSMTVAVLITNYMAWQTTRQTVLAALNHSKDGITRIVVVDDHSDAPEKWEHGGNVTIVRNAYNLGYASSINVGMSLLSEDLVVILDCDALPLNDFTDPVMERFRADPKLGALGFMQTDESDRLRPSGERCPTALEFLIGPSLLSRGPSWFVRMVDASKRPSFLCLHSCSFAVRNAAFKELGGFDANFDFLDADIDFSIRMNHAGWRTGLTSEVVCFHPGGGSPQSTTTRVLRLHRNRLHLLRKHGLLRNVPLAKACLAARHLVEIAMLLVSVFMGRHQARSKLDCRWKLLRGVFNDY